MDVRAGLPAPAGSALLTRPPALAGLGPSASRCKLHIETKGAILLAEAWEPMASALRREPAFPARWGRLCRCLSKPLCPLGINPRM